MYIKLPDNDDFHCVYLSSVIELSAISKRIPVWFAKPYRLNLTNHLFNMRIPEKLFNAIRDLVTNDKKYEFKK